MNLQRTSITTEYKVSLTDLKSVIANALAIDLKEHDISVRPTTTYDDMFKGLEVTVTRKDKS